jgi:hypothetical protein
MRTVPYLLMLSLAVLGFATPPSARAQGNATLLETLTVPAALSAGPRITSSTVLQQGATYTLVVTGTVTITFQQYGTLIDALYCYGELLNGAPVPSEACDPPQLRSRLLIFELGGVRRGFEEIGAPPYDPNHRYEVTFTAWATGNLVAQQSGAISTPTGGYTVAIYSTGTTTTTLPACPPQGNGLFGPLGRGCPAPHISSFTGPPAAVAGQPAPFVLTFSDPDENASRVEVTEMTQEEFLGNVPIDPPSGGGTYAIQVRCNNNIPRVAVTRTIRIYVRDTHGNSSNLADWTFSCVPKPLMRQWALWSQLVVGTGGTALAALAPAPPWVKVAGVGLGLTAASGALAGIIDNDPPDPNYATVVEAQPPPVPTLVAARDGVPTEFADAMNALLAIDAQITGIGRALVISLERSQGAANAGDLAAYSRQIAATADFAGRWGTVIGAEPDIAVRTVSAWRAAGLPELEVTAEEVAFWQESVLFGGFDPDLSDILAGLQIDEREMGFIYSAIETLDPQEAEGSVTQKLSDPNRATVSKDVATALGAFAQQLSTPPAGSSCGSCDDGNACTDDACSGRSCTHTLRPGVEGIACVLDNIVPSACGEEIPVVIYKKLSKARRLVQKALAHPGKVRKFLGKARKVLGPVAKAAAKAKRKRRLAAECADVLGAGAINLRGQIEAVVAAALD